MLEGTSAEGIITAVEMDGIVTIEDQVEGIKVTETMTGELGN